MSECVKYFGKYRGSCINNIDPLKEGRIQVAVPDILDLSPTTWATPALPSGGPQYGLFTIPPIGAGVWVEFEKGELDYPIWTGCFFGSAAEVPALAQALVPGLAALTMQTPTQTGLTVNDGTGPTGGLFFKSASGKATMTINDTGITIRVGAASISVTDAGVAINGANLVVAV